MKSSKSYHASLLAYAMKRLQAGNEQRAVANSLVTEYGCARSTAHRVTQKAAAVLTGQRSADTWGGQRPGAGRPKPPKDN